MSMILKRAEAIEAEFVTALQSIVTKNVSALDPVVLSVGRFHGGTQAMNYGCAIHVQFALDFFDSGEDKAL